MIDLCAGDIFDTGKQLIELNTKHKDDLSKIKIQKEERKLAKKFLDAAVKAAENTLRDSAVWKDLQENKRVLTSTNFQEGLYKAAVTYTDYLHNETKEINNAKVVVSVANQPTTYFNDPNKGVFVHPESNHTRIILPSNFYKGYQDQNDCVKVIFMAFQNLNCINNSLPCFPDEAKSEDDMQAAAQVNSAIIGAKIGDASTWYASDGENVVIQFEHIYNGTAYRLSGSRCAWWNVTGNSWESQGCSVNATNDHFTVCHCDHLTNLAVIMDIGSRLQRGTVPYEVMQLITIIGSSVSIFSLLLCILCFALFKKTTQGKIKGHNFSRMNLCICLLLAKVVMLAGLDATDNKPACTIVAIILHYLFLAMLAWSATEAYHLYKNFFLIFNRDGSRKRTFLVVGYVGPLFIVIVTFILSNYNGHWTHKGYGTDQACWLSDKLIWSFAGVALPVLLVNASLFVLTMKKVWEKRRQVNKSIIPTLAGSISIFLFLCLTWLSGYFYFAEGSEPAAVLFTILNAFIGVPMFVFSFLLDNSRTGQVKKTTKKWNEQTQGSQLTRHNHQIGEIVSSNFDVKRRNITAATEHSISASVTDGAAWSSSSGSSTPSSEQTYYENGSSNYDPCGNCSTSSGVTVSSRTCQEDRVVTAIVHSGTGSSGSSVTLAPGAISLPDSEPRVDDFSICEVILSPSMFAPSSQESCDGEDMAVDAVILAGKLSYLSPTPYRPEVSVAVAGEKNWDCLEMQRNSQWGERRW
ncbi:adhesion G protein-coupled receptor L4-like isoform X1 [Macrobrachium nipponense]|uniref:adhesion G protein-coupled receptor L4-like isoform X1 n=1 Tax=Macrobrachium nipponense TaxID=159736 RepID=UPI0030C866D5